MRACPHCQGTGLAPEAIAADAVEREMIILKAACREGGLWVSPNDEVREADAAELLGLARKTLINWRSGDDRLGSGTRAGRPVYALRNLAEYLAKR